MAGQRQGVLVPDRTPIKDVGITVAVVLDVAVKVPKVDISLITEVQTLKEGTQKRTQEV